MCIHRGMALPLKPPVLPQLARPAKTLPIGTAYASWVGIGAAGAVILGIALLGESDAPARLFCLALLLVSIVGLS